MATLFQVRFTKAELDRLGCTHSELLEEGCRACHVSAALRRSFIVDELPDYPDLLEAPDDWYGIRWWTDWNPPGRRIVEGRYPDGDTAAKAALTELLALAQGHPPVAALAQRDARDYK